MRKIIEPSLSWNIGDVRCPLLCSMKWNEEVWREHSDGERLRWRLGRWLKMSMLTFTPLLHLSITEQFLFPRQPEDAAVIQLRYISRVYWISEQTLHLITYFKQLVCGRFITTYSCPTSLSWCYQIQLLASQPAGNSAKLQVFECCVGQSATLYLISDNTATRPEPDENICLANSCRKHMLGWAVPHVRLKGPSVIWQLHNSACMCVWINPNWVTSSCYKLPVRKPQHILAKYRSHGQW